MAERFSTILKREIPITDYAERLGFTLIRKGRYYSLKEHDSVIIDTEKNCFWRNSRFSRWSVGGAGSVIDFAIEFSDAANAREAMQKLSAMYGIHGESDRPQFSQTSYTRTQRRTQIRQAPEAQTTFTLPERARDNSNVFRYLSQERQIHRDVIQYFLERDMLYQDVRRNCVFHTDSFGCVRSTGDKRFVADVPGSNYDECFYFRGSNEAKKLIVAESVIDVMSVMSYLTLNNRKFSDYCFLALAGTNKLESVFHHLEKEEGGLDTVILCLDNDEAGHRAVEKIQDKIAADYQDTECRTIYPPSGKDWNDYLKIFTTERVAEKEDEPHTFSDTYTHGEEAVSQEMGGDKMVLLDTYPISQAALLDYINNPMRAGTGGIYRDSSLFRGMLEQLGKEQLTEEERRELTTELYRRYDNAWSEQNLLNAGRGYSIFHEEDGRLELVYQHGLDLMPGSERNEQIEADNIFMRLNDGTPHPSDYYGVSLMTGDVVVFHDNLSFAPNDFHAYRVESVGFSRFDDSLTPEMIARMTVNGNVRSEAKAWDDVIRFHVENGITVNAERWGHLANVYDGIFRMADIRGVLAEALQELNLQPNDVAIPIQETAGEIMRRYHDRAIYTENSDWKTQLKHELNEVLNPDHHREVAHGEDEFAVLPLKNSVNGAFTHFVRLSNVGISSLPLNTVLYVGTLQQCDDMVSLLQERRLGIEEARERWKNRVNDLALDAKEVRELSQIVTEAAIESTNDFEDNELFQSRAGLRNADVQNPDGSYGEAWREDFYRIVSVNELTGLLEPIDFRVFATKEQALEALQGDSTLREINYDRIVEKASDRATVFRDNITLAMREAGHERDIHANTLTYQGEGTTLQFENGYRGAYEWLLNRIFDEPEKNKAVERALRPEQYGAYSVLRHQIEESETLIEDRQLVQSLEDSTEHLSVQGIENLLAAIQEKVMIHAQYEISAAEDVESLNRALTVVSETTHWAFERQGIQMSEEQTSGISGSVRDNLIGQYQKADTAEAVYTVNKAFDSLRTGFLQGGDWGRVQSAREGKEAELNNESSRFQGESLRESEVSTMPENQYGRDYDERLGDKYHTAEEWYTLAKNGDIGTPDTLDAIKNILTMEAERAEDEALKGVRQEQAERVGYMAARERTEADPEVDTFLYNVEQLKIDFMDGNGGLDKAEITDGVFLSVSVENDRVLISIRDDSDPEQGSGQGESTMSLNEFKGMSQNDFNSFVGQVYSGGMVYTEPERTAEPERMRTEQERTQAVRPHGEEGGALETPKDRLARQLMDGVSNVMNTEKFRAWLDTSSRLYTNNYSFRNSLLIFSQKPNASYCMGYEAWKEFGRNVRKGAKAAQIFVPVIAYEKTDGALFRMIKNNLDKQLKENPAGNTATYRVGTSKMEFTLNHAGVWGLRIAGKEHSTFGNETQVKRFIQNNVLNKVPMYFTVGNVFDIKDTATPQYLWLKKGFTKDEMVRDDKGRAIKNDRGEYKIKNTPERIARFNPTLEQKIVEHDPAKMATLLDALKAVSERNGVPVTEMKHDADDILKSDAKGYYSRETNAITLDVGLLPTEKAATLLHEMGHADLHGDLDKLQRVMGDKVPRSMREVQAESVAYAVARQFGIETDTSSFAYVASWSNGTQLQDLAKSIEVIYNESRKLTKEIGAELDIRGLNLDLSEKTKAPLLEETRKDLAAAYMTRAIAAEELNNDVLSELPSTAEQCKGNRDLLDNLVQQQRVAKEQRACIVEVKTLCDQLAKSTDRKEQDAIIEKLDAGMKRIEAADQKIEKLSEGFMKLCMEQKPGRYEVFTQKPKAIIAELKENFPTKFEGLSASQVDYIANSDYIRKQLAPLLNSDSTGQKFAEVVTQRAAAIGQVAAKNGSFVEISFCEQWTEKTIVRAGALMHPNVANSIIKQAEAECLKLKKEAELKGDYFPYTKCNMTVYTLDESKKLTPHVTRVDIGDGYQASLSNFLHNEIGKESPICKALDAAIRERGAKDKILFNDPAQADPPPERKAVALDQEQKPKTQDKAVTLEEAKERVAAEKEQENSRAEQPQKQRPTKQPQDRAD